MDFEHIKNLFKEKDLIIEKINGCSDELLKKILLSVFDKMNFIEDNLMIFSKYFDKKITYSSYYTYSENLENNLNNFNAYYEGSDKEERYMAFSLYVFGRMIDELIANVLENNEFDIDSLLGLLDIGDYYNDLLTCSTNLEKMVKKKQLDEMLREKESLSFLSDDVKYKILFTGLMADDIKNLPRHLLLQFIKK